MNSSGRLPACQTTTGWNPAPRKKRTRAKRFPPSIDPHQHVAYHHFNESAGENPHVRRPLLAPIFRKAARSVPHMKAEHRKELETNTLADKMGTVMQRVKTGRRGTFFLYVAAGDVLVI